MLTRPEEQRRDTAFPGGKADGREASAEKGFIKSSNGPRKAGGLWASSWSTPARCALMTPVRSRSFWTGARAAAGSVCGGASPSCGGGRRRRGEGRGEGGRVLATHTESGYGWPLSRARSLLVGALLIPFPRFGEYSRQAGKHVPGSQPVCHGSAPTASKKGRAGAAGGPGEPFSRALVRSQ